MWRLAKKGDDDSVVAMCRALNEEDPGPEPVPDEYMRRTLEVLRAEPARGCVAVLDLGQGPQGYALLISFWSNELGGELCAIDEIYVHPELRSNGYGRELIESVATGDGDWPFRPTTLELEVNPENKRAQKLYARAGFDVIRNIVMRRTL